jgi:hypothetical protein
MYIMRCKATLHTVCQLRHPQLNVPVMWVILLLLIWQVPVEPIYPLVFHSFFQLFQANARILPHISQRQLPFRSIPILNSSFLACCLLGLLFNLDDRGSMFLQSLLKFYHIVTSHKMALSLYRPNFLFVHKLTPVCMMTHPGAPYKMIYYASYCSSLDKNKSQKTDKVD